jgi:hypothetical protein
VVLYRSLLGVLLVVAVVLTLNERYLEERARRNADSSSSPSRIFLNEPSASVPTSPPSSASAQTNRPAFVPHRVRLRRDVELLRAPEPTAPKSDPVSFVVAGIPAQAVEERAGWYLLETSLARGWAPTEAVEEP